MTEETETLASHFKLSISLESPLSLYRFCVFKNSCFEMLRGLNFVLSPEAGTAFYRRCFHFGALGCLLPSCLGAWKYESA